MNIIYLVKKDPNKPNSQGNWITMNYAEFKVFISSPDGRTRAPQFSAIPPALPGDPTYIAECGEEIAKDWDRENNRRKNLAQARRATGYKSVSYEELIERNEGFLSREEILSDESCLSVEDQAISHIQQETIRRELGQLREDERRMLQAVYFDEARLSERVFGDAVSVSRDKVSRLKRRVLCNLKDKI